MRTIATVLATLAAALGATAFAQQTTIEVPQGPKALGWERGQGVPESAIMHGAAQGPLKMGYAQPVAGLDEVIVTYTEKQGVCAVIGIREFTSDDGYNKGHRARVDEWAGRVAAKFGGVAGAKKAGANSYSYEWREEELPEGYAVAIVAAGGAGGRSPEPGQPASSVVLHFRFDNWDACVAELEAAMQAEL